MNKTFRIFYSWQSTINDNRSYIRNAIKKVIKQTKEYKLELDEATRDTPGSPDIAQTILNKIRVSDIFICDLTIVAEYNDEKKGMPNPNVLFELGVAVSSLGWERIICVVNSKYGSIETLPFDINHHRCLCYSRYDNRELMLFNPIEKIISDYDNIVERFNKNGILECNKRTFDKLMEICTETELIDFLNKQQNTYIYNDYEYKMLESLTLFLHYPENRFTIYELNTSFEDLSKAIEKLISDFGSYYVDMKECYEYEYPEQKYSMEGKRRILQTHIHKLREPDYDNNTFSENEYFRISKIIIEDCQDIINRYTEFRNLVKNKVFV